MLRKPNFRIRKNGVTISESWTRETADRNADYFRGLYPNAEITIEEIKRRARRTIDFDRSSYSAARCDARTNFDERNDCAVIALSIAAQMDYKSAHEMMSEYCKRPDGKGVNNSELFSFCNTLFEHTFEGGRARRKTLNRLMPELQHGRYLVSINGHIFAVVDGKICDHTQHDICARVWHVWKVQ